MVLPDVDCPVGGHTPSMPAHPAVTYDPVTGVLEVNGAPYPMPAGTYYFHEFKKSGGDP